MARHGDQQRKLPAASQRLCFLYLLTVALSICQFGCGDTKVNQATKSEPDNTAQEDFEWAMERLQQALDTSGSVARLNLRVKRELTYQLLPPDASRNTYAARVTIKTRSDYIPDSPIAVESKDVEQPTPSIDPEDDPTAALEAITNSRPQKPLIAEPPTKFPNIEETKVYELAYLDKRWQLQSEIDSEHEQMWFDYSLQQ